MVSVAFIGEQHIAASTDDPGLDDPNSPNNPDGSGDEVPLCCCGTSVVVDKTAIGFWEIATEYNWTVVKTMDPSASDMTIGDSMDVDVIIDADREQTGSSEEVWGVRGEITVTNTGDHSTSGFEIWDVVQKRVGTNWVDIYCTWVLHPWIEELGSGETKSYSYEIFFDGPVDASAQYRNIAKVRIKNHSGHIGCWYGPDEKESFTIPSTPTVTGSTDYTATLVDSMVVPMGLSVSGDMDGPWYLSGPSTIEYTITVTNTGLASGECAKIVNTAILTEDDTLEERTDDANVTICSLGLPPGELIAYKFNDTNMNGIWDEGEYPIQGWTIYLKDTQGNTIATGITDSDGKVVFSPLVVGTYIVEEDDGDGWFNTTSDSFEIPIGPEQTVEVEFGNAQWSGIEVFKFYDLNANGVWNCGEPGLEGWTFTVDGMGSSHASSTGADGRVVFDELQPGHYTVAEILKPGFYPTTPLVVEVDLGINQTVQLSFGNAEFAWVDVFKFNDVNQNGTWDVGELPLGGWTIEVYDGQMNLVDSNVTDSMGWTGFSLKDGTYTIKEVMKDGWEATTPISVVLAICPGDWYVIEFGNYQPSSIVVEKFYDIDADGIRDNGEPWLEDWTFTLYDSGMNPISSGITNVSGQIVFNGLSPGTYYLVEDLQAGWFNTTPLIRTITLEQGEMVIERFGNLEYSSIEVFKFYDLNVNGIFDGDDYPLSGWNITLEGPGVSIWALTDSNGIVVFDNLLPGTYVISEVLPDDCVWLWYNTTEVPIIVELTPGESAQVEIGNVLNSRISVMKRIDLNGDGIIQSDEPSVSGWTIEVYKDGEFYASGETIADDWLNFENLTHGHYLVKEIMKPGWTHLYGTEFDFDSTPGIRYLISFANVQLCDLTAQKYNDLNENGQKDEGEPWLAGWTFNLLDEYGAPVASAVTDENGEAKFTDLMSGDYCLEELGQLGWYNTTPMSKNVTLAPGDNVTELFGNAEYAHIHVFKFYDTNLNGIFDCDDYPIQGWNISIAGEESSWQLTDENGWANFSCLMPGAYEVSEEMRNNWFVITGDCTQEVELESGMTEEICFGNAEYATITIHKFYDRNMNGSMDEGEQPLSWSFLVDDGYMQFGVETNESGVVEFDLYPGTMYVIVEEIKNGWFPTTMPFAVIVPSPGEDIHLYFSNCEYGTICAYKFNDTNENGIWDEGEDPLAGWTIYLKDMANNTLATGVTDIDGRICFVDLIPGQYMLEEELLPEWYNITPKVRIVNLEPGELEEVYFGNALPSYCLEIVKTGPAEMCWGNEIVWNITVCNCGNEPLRCVKVWDPLTGFSTMIPYLDIGECRSFETSIYVPYGWCYSNWITNTVYASAWVDSEHNVTDEASHTVFVAKPDIDMVKTGPEVAIRGQTVLYEITIINDGNVPLWNVRVTDPMIGLDDTIPFLDVDESMTYRLSFTIPDDWNCSVITNWAQVEAWYFGIFEPRECFTEDMDCHEIVIVEAELTVIKTGPESATAGEWVQFNIQVINTGDVWLESVYVYDSDISIEPIMIGDLAPGQSVNVSVDFMIPEDCSDEFTNTATAIGQYQGVELSDSDGWTVIIEDTPMPP